MAKKTKRKRKQDEIPIEPGRWKPKKKVDTTRAPKWWITRPDEVWQFLESLNDVEVSEIGQSAGGRPILAASWGPRQDLPGRTCNSIASAVAGGKPEAFYGEGERERQVLMFVGAAHGTEVEGTLAALNILKITVTGKDLLGRQRTRIAEEARRLRLIVIPFLNIDGRERWREHVHFIGVDTDFSRHVTMGEWKNGEKLSWPTCKLHHPIPVDKVRALGSYYNDNGVNLVYDTPFAGDCQPETTALLRFCREEMPDCVILSHTDNGSLVQPPSAFIPQHYRLRQTQIGALAGMRCAREGLAKSRIPKQAHSYAGEQLYQTDAVYHNCGALPLLIEFPCGYQNVPDNHEEILDIGTSVLAEIVAFGNQYPYRPPDPRWK